MHPSFSGKRRPRLALRRLTAGAVKFDDDGRGVLSRTADPSRSSASRSARRPLSRRLAAGRSGLGVPSLPRHPRPCRLAGDDGDSLDPLYIELPVQGDERSHRRQLPPLERPLRKGFCIVCVGDHPPFRQLLRPQGAQARGFPPGCDLLGDSAVAMTSRSSRNHIQPRQARGPGAGQA